MAINQNPFLEALKRGNFGQGPAPEVPQVTPSIQVPQMIGTGAAPIFDKAQTVGEFLQSPFATGVEAAAGQAQSGQPLPAGTTIRTPEQDIAAARGLPDPSAGITTTSLGPNFQQTGVGQVGSPVPQVPVAPAAVGQGTVMQAPSQAFESAGIPQQQFDPQSIPTPQAPAAGPTFGGQPLSEFLAGGTQLDPQGRMIDPSVDRSEYEQAAAGREQRLESMLADRAAARQAQRGGEDGGITDSQFRALSEGNQDVERRLRAQAELGMGPFAQKPEGLTPEQEVAKGRLELDEKKFMADLMQREGAKAPLTPEQKKFAEEAGKGAYSWNQGGQQVAQENINTFSKVLSDLESGQIDTRTLGEFIPLGGDWWRSAINPTGQQALDNIRGVIFQGLRETLGAQFTQKEGERLVEASYNPKLSEADNIARLKPALERMQATFEAKNALTQHIMDGGSVRDYQGPKPMDVYKSFDNRGGAGGSPIQGDVDYASAADDILAGK
jgi:hypothetical protein